MAGLFWRQLWALFVKNWIVISKHPILNLIRCLIAPIAYGVFLAEAQHFLSKPNDFGIGNPITVYSLQDVFDPALAFVWADDTNGTGTPSAQQVINHITSGFSSQQLGSVVKADSTQDVINRCPENFNLFSECWAGLSFQLLPNATNASATYSIYVDGGLSHVDVVKHTSDSEERALPLQWAVESAIIELMTGVQPQTPLEWPFTHTTNQFQDAFQRTEYVQQLSSVLSIAFFITLVGVAYQLPGSYMGERANLLTSHLQAMGLMESARIISWHLSLSLAYLPAWIIVALVWRFQLFLATSVWLVLAINILSGLSLASWSFFLAAPFEKSPQLAAVAATFLSILMVIISEIILLPTGIAFIFTLLFPSTFFVFAIKIVANYEGAQIQTNALHGDPSNSNELLPLMIAALINIFIWPYFAILWERSMYDARDISKHSVWWWCCCCCLFRRKKRSDEVDPHADAPPDTCISIRNLNMTFRKQFLKSSSSNVTAIENLSLDIPKTGIFVLLGSNGAGKSTVLSILANLLGRTGGSVMFEGGARRPPRSSIGIVPQKNVLFPELTCYQHLQVWKGVKRRTQVSAEEDIMQLLKDCDLGQKIHARADSLSGGQKRKLQLAIGLIGGSSIVLVDEATSGVDPLSRRSLWRTLTSVRDERTIVFTTHFLDEADFLADHVAILAAPGKLIAKGTPVVLKSSLGDGYTLQLTLVSDSYEKHMPPAHMNTLLENIHTVAPNAYLSSWNAPVASYHLKAKDSPTVEKVLNLIEARKSELGVVSYDVHGTSMEDVFLSLMKQHGIEHPEDMLTPGEEKSDFIEASPALTVASNEQKLMLSNGRRRSPWSQALTIFHKRYLVFRRSWLSLAVGVIVAICGSCIPLLLLKKDPPSCVTKFEEVDILDLYAPNQLQYSFVFPSEQNVNDTLILTSPPGIASSLGAPAANFNTTPIADQQTFIQAVQDNYIQLQYGGLSIDPQTGVPLVAWEADSFSTSGFVILNLASNIQYSGALNTSNHQALEPAILQLNYANFPPVKASTLNDLKWTIFFGAAMAVYPAFFALYPSHERRSSVQAMQLSNGLANPAGLWLGHLLFDSMFGVVMSVVIAVVFATASNQFHGVGYFWLVFFLYGICSALFGYLFTLFTTSPLAAFGALAGYQFVIFLLYTAGYLLTLTFAKTTQSSHILTIIHFTVSLIAPVCSVLRASFISVNLFSLLCDGNQVAPTSSLGTILKYGGPILYLILQSIALFGVLVWYDSGAKFPRSVRQLLSRPFGGRKFVAGSATGQKAVPADVTSEAKIIEESDDPLRVLHITKAFDRSGTKAVDDVTFGVSQDTVLALLGPNGAGKTTTFNIIRGDIKPSEGDVLIQGTSVTEHARTARLHLGVCPQFTAIDSQLTTREHLMVYGRLKGLYRGTELNENVEAVMAACALSQYADRLASKLSGGNQRKLSLAIALLGNPSVVLIDEFSTGIDAKTKRDMWVTLRNVAVGKAVVITTHSMEEASALANKLVIVASRLLAVGSTESLASRYPIYEVHFATRNREDIVRAQELMARIPGARLSDDVATRFEVPLQSEDNMRSLAGLFKTLSEHGDFADYTVERVSLETIFLKVIRENDVREEDSRGSGQRSWKWWKSV